MRNSNLWHEPTELFPSGASSTRYAGYFPDRDFGKILAELRETITATPELSIVPFERSRWRSREPR